MPDLGELGQGAYARGTITSSVGAGTIPSLCGVVQKGQKWEECCAGARSTKMRTYLVIGNQRQIGIVHAGQHEIVRSLMHG
ncbi:hypothetical protein DPMN_070529 [Dreissena polymorpha]|uniref:Uncharacterized protein n=1 Tax=Dreissena polymorpha TaxID=45954 RepID=A0A9D3Z154_DREPO|nr:hypothetical protein DPMN_070529 [Dreissena polymorpha]